VWLCVLPPKIHRMEFNKTWPYWRLSQWARNDSILGYASGILTLRVRKGIARTETYISGGFPECGYSRNGDNEAIRSAPCTSSHPWRRPNYLYLDHSLPINTASHRRKLWSSKQKSFGVPDFRYYQKAVGAAMFSSIKDKLAGPSGRAVYGRSPPEIVGSNPTGGMDVLSVVSVVCCQVEVSATGWSLVQRSPTECGASLCMIKKPQEWGGHDPDGPQRHGGGR